MEELVEIYKALNERIKEMKQIGFEEDQIEIELRLDIENVLDLLAKEHGIILEKNKLSIE
jgi:hypothetical protein